jgi:hypothetical protein
MSATVFLFATEDVVDAFENQLDKVFTEGEWKIEGREYSDTWGTPPEKMTLEVTNWSKKVVGKIEVTNRYDVNVEHDGEPFVTAVPEKVEIWKDGKKVDLFPMKTKLTFTIEMNIEHSEDITAQEAADVVTQEMNYDFNYNSDNVRIVKTEITDTNP